MEFPSIHFNFSIYRRHFGILVWTTSDTLNIKEIFFSFHTDYFYCEIHKRTFRGKN